MHQPKDVEKLEPSNVASGNVKWGSRCGRWSDSSLNMLNIELTHDPATPRLGIYLSKMKSNVHAETEMWTCMFIAAPPIRAKR